MCNTTHKILDPTANLFLKSSSNANHVPLCVFSLSGPSTDGHIGVLQVRTAHRGLLPGSPAPEHEQGLWAPVPGPGGAGGTRTLRRPIRWSPSFRACSPSVRHPHPTAVSRRWTRPRPRTSPGAYSLPPTWTLRQTDPQIYGTAWWTTDPQERTLVFVVKWVKHSLICHSQESSL